MGKCKCRLIFIFVSELGKLCNYVYQFLLNQFQSFCHNNNVCIISYITGCCSQVDDSLCFRALHTVSIYMGHNIVTHFFLTGLGNIIVDIVCMSFQFINLFLGDVQSKLLLSLCQSVFSRCGISYPVKKCTAFPCWHNAQTKGLYICLYSFFLSCF